MIGRWSLTALVLNSIVGSGIFGLPSTLAGLVGPWSPVAVLIAGLAIFTIALCFAEVGSRFDRSGGPYLYTREAFGPALGFHIGWLHIWTRIFSGAALLNVLVAYLAVLFPVLGTAVGRALVMILGMLFVTVINVVGVRQASWTVNAFTIAKLLPLLLLLAIGLPNLRHDVLVTQFVPRSEWTDAVLILLFAYGGFESSALAAGEVRDPKRDTPFAILLAMTVVTLLYASVQLAVVGVVPFVAKETAPVSTALRILLGSGGATLGAVAVVISVYGWLSGFALATPRISHAMGERGELPSFFARVHQRYRTPYTAIIFNSVAVLTLALFSGFVQAATISVVTRLGIFALTCVALIVFRKRLGAAPYAAPAGPALAVIGVAFCAYLLSTRTLSEAWMLPVLMLIAAAIWRFRPARHA